MRRALPLAGLAVLLVGGVGALHLPGARPLLLAVSGSTCPVGFGAELTPSQRDEARSAALAQVLGTSATPSRAAFGFVLATTKRADLERWASSHSVACSAGAGTLRCDHVPAGALEGLGAADSILFQLDAGDHLVGLSASRTVSAPEDAVQAVNRGAAGLSTTLGAPTAARGHADPTWLAAGPLNQLSRDFRYADYRARVEATNVGNGRYTLRGVAQVVTPDT